MESLVLILIGLPGSGKSTASSFFTSQNIPVIRMGELTFIELEKKKLKISFENEKYVKEELRKLYGKKVYAQRVIGRIKDLAFESKVIVIEGMKSKDELDIFRSYFRNIKIFFVDSDKKNRYKRLEERKFRPLNNKQAQERDKYETNTFSLETLRQEADYVIENNENKAKFYIKLKDVLELSQE